MNPIKVIEYMASGKAIVASDLPAIRDCISDKTAVLVDPDDLRGWCNALIQLSNDEKFCEEMSRQARQAFGAGFTWEARAEKLLGIFKEGA